MPVTLPITSGNLPEGLCPTSEQERLNSYVAAMLVNFPFNYTFINTGPTAPSADNRIFPWYRSNMDGTPDKLYSYVNGFWIAPHPTPASSPTSIIYKGSLASIDTYDGGESGTVTSTTGPMWQVDTDLSGKFPLGVSTDYPLGTTGGSEEVTLNQNQIPDIDLELGMTTNVNGGATTSGGAGINLGRLPDTWVAGRIRRPTSFVQQDVNILNPYRAVYFIKRTARAFYRL